MYSPLDNIYIESDCSSLGTICIKTNLAKLLFMLISSHLFNLFLFPAEYNGKSLKKYFSQNTQLPYSQDIRNGGQLRSESIIACHRKTRGFLPKHLKNP